MKFSLKIDESSHLEQGSLKSHFVGKVDSAASPHGQIDVNEGAGHMRQGQVGHHLHIFTIKKLGGQLEEVLACSSSYFQSYTS